MCCVRVDTKRFRPRGSAYQPARQRTELFDPRSQATPIVERVVDWKFHGLPGWVRFCLPSQHLKKTVAAVAVRSRHMRCTPRQYHNTRMTCLHPGMQQLCGQNKNRTDDNEYTNRPAHECVPPRDTAMAVRPVPRSMKGRLSPMVFGASPIELLLPCPSWPLEPKPARASARCCGHSY